MGKNERVEGQDPFTQRVVQQATYVRLQLNGMWQCRRCVGQAVPIGPYPHAGHSGVTIERNS